MLHGQTRVRVRGCAEGQAHFRRPPIAGRRVANGGPPPQLLGRRAASSTAATDAEVDVSRQHLQRNARLRQLGLALLSGKQPGSLRQNRQARRAAIASAVTRGVVVSSRTNGNRRAVCSGKRGSSFGGALVLLSRASRCQPHSGTPISGRCRSPKVRKLPVRCAQRRRSVERHGRVFPL